MLWLALFALGLTGMLLSLAWANVKRVERHRALNRRMERLVADLKADEVALERKETSE